MRIALVTPLVLCAGLLACSGSTGDAASGADDDAGMASYNEGLPDVGATLPAIAAVTLDGKSVTNGSLHGKTVLLNLWFFH